MILDLPFRYAARAAIPGGSGDQDVSLWGRLAVEVRELDDERAPVAVRWRPQGSPWRWTRAVGTTHHAPVAAPPGREGAAVAAADALLADQVESSPCLSEDEGLLRNARESRRVERETQILARASTLLVVNNVLYERCHEPVLCESSPGGDVVVIVGPVLDWSAAMPMSSVPSLRGRLRYEVEVRNVGSFSVDPEHVLRRVIRKSLILARSGGVAAAAPLVDTTMRHLDSGSVSDAAASMGGCLGLIAQSPSASPRLRDFSARTSAYLLGMATELAA